MPFHDVWKENIAPPHTTKHTSTPEQLSWIVSCLCSGVDFFPLVTLLLNNGSGLAWLLSDSGSLEPASDPGKEVLVTCHACLGELSSCPGLYRLTTECVFSQLYRMVCGKRIPCPCRYNESDKCRLQVCSFYKGAYFLVPPLHNNLCKKHSGPPPFDHPKRLWSPWPQTDGPPPGKKW